MIKVVVLGAGNVGIHLCLALEKNPNIVLVQNYNRKNEKIPNCNVPVTHKAKAISKADVYIFTFNDDALLTIPDNFSHLEGLILHTSGSTPLDILSNFNRSGIFYPVQSFNKKIPVTFSEIPIAIEASSVKDEQFLLNFAKQLTPLVYILNSEQRNTLHIAAVFANNFSNFMYSQAEEICSEKHIDFDILKPLIRETISKIATSSPKKIQTGPAIRKDSKTIERHITTLTDPKKIKLYQLLTTAIQNYYE